MWIIIEKLYCRTIINIKSEFHSYEERARSIDTVTRNHKEAMTFEEFAANVYSPIQPQSPFSGASSVSGLYS